MKNRQFWVALAVMILTATLLPGCGMAAQPEPENPPLRVQWAFWEGDFTVMIAQEKGFFEKHGVEVEPIYYETFSQAIPDIAGGKIDAGMFAMGDAILATTITNLKIVAAEDSGGNLAIVAAPEIKTIADLRGKRIGVNVGSYAEMLVREMLQLANLEIKDVTLVNVGPEDVPGRLAAKDIQAGYVWEPYTSEALAQGSTAIHQTGELSLFPDVVVFREEITKNRPDDVRAFLDAWFEAVQYRKDHPEECTAIMAKILQVEEEEVAPSNLILFTRDENLALFTDLAGTDISSIYFTAQQNINFMISIGNITHPPKLEDLLDPTFMQKE